MADADRFDCRWLWLASGDALVEESGEQFRIAFAAATAWLVLIVRPVSWSCMLGSWPLLAEFVCWFLIRWCEFNCC